MKKKIFVLFAVVCVIFFVLILVLNVFVFPRKYKNYVVAYSEEYGLETSLVYAMIKAESDFDKNAVSPSGALGLMQLLPSTAKWIAEELGEFYEDSFMFNEDVNIRYGCFYLKYLFDKFGDTDTVICAYNAGETKVREWFENGRVVIDKIDYLETKTYLKRVKGFYNIYKNEYLYI